MRTFLSLIVLTLLALSAHAQQSAPMGKVGTGQYAGRVTLVSGQVSIAPADGVAWSPKVNDAVRQGDAVTSGADGELHLTMRDGSFIAIRPDTQFKIIRFVAEGSDNDQASYQLLKGALRSITGWIGKFKPRNYALRTPTATIGIRGTDHETTYVAAGTPDVEEGTYDKVNIGGTYLENPDGKVNVEANGAGFAPPPGQGRPRLLDRVPGIFKRSANEQLIDTQHDRIHQHLEQLRQERQKEIREREQAADSTQPDRPADDADGPRENASKQVKRKIRKLQNQRK